MFDGQNRIKCRFPLVVIFSYRSYYHQSVAILRSLCCTTNDFSYKHDDMLRAFCVVYSGQLLEFDLCRERNSVLMLKGTGSEDVSNKKLADFKPFDEDSTKLYYKDLILRNWRYPSNDLQLDLRPLILRHIGFENLKF